MKTYRTEAEKSVGPAIASIFEACSDSTEQKLQNFPKYVRRQHLKRFLTMYEIFKLILPVKGSIIECGVFRGFGYYSWLKLSAMLEPENLMRKIYGFDTFDGFPSLDEKDQNNNTQTHIGDLSASSYEELIELGKWHDQDRFLGHVQKGYLYKGDIAKTLPKFFEANPHVIVSLLFLDCDLYEPTRVALETVLPRMPKGAVIAFDELDNEQWPGETLALIETCKIANLKLQRMEWDPYISYAVID